MTFSLLNVHSQNEDKTVNGSWVQDHIGNLESAKEVAKRTEAVNSNKIRVAVVPAIPCAVPILGYFTNVKVLG